MIADIAEFIVEGIAYVVIVGLLSAFVAFARERQTGRGLTKMRALSSADVAHAERKRAAARRLHS